METTKMMARMGMLLALLLVATAGDAQKTVTMHRGASEGCPEMDIQVTFSGYRIKNTRDDDSYKCFEAVMLNSNTITASTKKIKMDGKYTMTISASFGYKDSQKSYPVGGGGEKRAVNKPLSISCKIPKKANHATLKITCESEGARASTTCYVDYQIVEPGSPEFEAIVRSDGVQGHNSHWGNKCDVCGRSKSHFSYSGVVGVEKCCQGEFKAKSTISENHGYRDYDINEPVYEFDRFRVGDEGEITLNNTQELGSSVKLCSNTIAVYMGEKNNQDRWYVISGHVLGQSLKGSKQQKLMQLSNGTVVSRSSVHTFMAEEVKQGSRVWNLAGTVAVKNKRTKKTYKLKAGQVATVTKDGKMSVKTFDVDAYAKKYKINLK